MTRAWGMGWFMGFERLSLLGHPCNSCPDWLRLCDGISAPDMKSEDGPCPLPTDRSLYHEVHPAILRGLF